MFLTVPQIRESEKTTMTDEPISSLDLMERAGTVFFENLKKENFLTLISNIYVFCGPGNNGGDGLVVARLLAQSGYRVHVVECIFGKRTTEEFRTNLERFQQVMNIFPKNTELSDFEIFATHFHNFKNALCIDALFGIGLTRPLEGDFLRVVNFINQNLNLVFSVDVPSGMYADNALTDSTICIRANFTYTFQFMKWEFALPMNYDKVGQVKVLDIGLRMPVELSNRGLPDETRTRIITAEAARAFLPRAERTSHKGTFGHALLIAGSKKMPGAAVMSAKAALRGGCGKLTVHTTPNVAAALPIALPEAIIDADACEECVSLCHWEDIDGLNAIAIGPGIGQAAKTKALLKALLSEVRHPCIFDADALNLLAADRTLLSYLPARSILTPHIKEFDRLAGASTSMAERVQKLCDFASKYNVIVILKGHNSVVAVPCDERRCELWLNTTGNAGMATAGSGDVLTGLLLGLLARTKTPEIAAILGTYIHGLAGDLALEWESEESLIASDISDNLGKAFTTIRDAKR